MKKAVRQLTLSTAALYGFLIRCSVEDNAPILPNLLSAARTIAWTVLARLLSQSILQATNPNHTIHRRRSLLQPRRAAKVLKRDHGGDRNACDVHSWAQNAEHDVSIHENPAAPLQISTGPTREC
jgi:hypothetical protein